MKDSAYWKERFVQLEAAQNRKGAETYAEIERHYRQAQKEIDAKIDAWYRRFADNNGVSMAEARRMLTARELAELKWDVNEYIAHGKENAIDQRWMKELENASARFHISRLEALKLQTQQSLEVMFGNQLDSVDAAMKRIFLDGYYHTAYELQRGFGIGWDIAGLDQRQIEKVIMKPWAVDGKNFSERIWGNKEKLITEVHNELTRNIMLGQDPQKAIDVIAKKMDTSKYNAGRLVMTEEAYFSSAAQKDCFNDLDVEQYEIVATLDSFTSDICREMDGKVFSMKDFEPGVTAPPFHVWCRSTAIPHFDDDFGQPGERAARGEDGKTYYVPADMTYQEWKESFVDEGKKSGLQEIKSDDTIKPRGNASVRPEPLASEQVIEKAKAFGESILCGEEKLNLNSGNPIFDFVSRKLGYDALPRVVNSEDFRQFAKDSPVGIIYRGITAGSKSDALKYAEDFKRGKMYAGKSHVYGSGTYFSPDISVADKYNNQGVMLYAALGKDARVVKYEDILSEYSSTGADVAKPKKGDNAEAWEDILSTIGEYAALKGYDAIDMAGIFGQNHIIVLNREKVVVRSE